MSDINFVSKDAGMKTSILRVRKLVISITTAGLVIYIVGVAGVFGWWWWVSNSQERTTQEVEEYTRQITAFSEADVVARRLSSRAKAVTDFLGARGEASSAAQILVGREEVSVIGWDYVLGGIQRVEVTGASPAKINEFTDYLEENYGQVQIEEIVWHPDRGWIGKVLVSERKTRT